MTDTQQAGSAFPLPGDLAPDKLAAMLNAAPIGIAILDPSLPGTPVTYANRELAAITGYGRDELLGRPLALLQGPLADTPSALAMAQAAAEGRPHLAEMVNFRKNGDPFWMRVDLRPLPDPSGIPRTCIAGFSDVTERRNAEEELKQSEERMRAFTGAIPLPMLTVRLDGIIRRANDSARELLGADLVGRQVHDFAIYEDDEQPMCAEIASTGRSERREIHARRHDGTPLWLLASARLYTVQGESRYVLVFQDVTELKRKEAQLQEANEEAERNIRARMRFLAAASHDLRQPLQAMALFASALDHHVTSAQGRTIVSSLKTSLRGMEEMFDSLLDMSKLDAGVMRAEPQAFMVNDLLEQLETTYRPQAEAAGLTFRVVPSSATLRSDPRLLARIVGNLLSNAIRYTRRGKVLLGVRRRGDRARLAVYDTGPGIPEDQRLEIFREFRQGAVPGMSGRGAGMGLGLAIVQRLSNLLGHPLDVRSAVGRGSAFAIDVPVVEESVAAAKEEEDEEHRDVDGATVVVVDDDPDIQEGLEMLLEGWGCVPVVAANAAEAVTALRSGHHRPDVILADLHLRGRESGLAAIREIRSRLNVDAPAFVFTGDTEALTELTGGLDSFTVLRKPLDPLRLRGMLADVLGR